MIERIAVFIDGSNLYHSLKKIGVKIDFEKLVNSLVLDRELVYANYYTTELDLEDNKKGYWKHKKFLEELKKISKMKIVLCTLKKIKQKDGSYSYFIKGDDAKLIHDFLVGAYEDEYDKAIIVSGDEDFEPMIKTAQRKGKKIGNAYFRSSSSSVLRNSCNFSICLNNHIKNLMRESK